MNKYLLRTLPWLFIAAGLLTTVIFFCVNLNSSELDDAVKGANYIGGIVGPLISAAGFFFLFLNLSEQRDTFHIERLESKYFEMIRFHRDNVNEMSFTYCEHPIEKKFVTGEKRKVFKLIHKQFEELYAETNFFFLKVIDDEIYELEYKNKLLQNINIKDRNIPLHTLARLDILYLIIFFGVSDDGIKTILQLTAVKYKTEFIEKVLKFAAFKPKKENDFWGDWISLNMHSSEWKNEKYTHIITQRNESKSIMGLSSLKCSDLEQILIFKPHSYEKYYGGHQFRLGHYFRNLFQAVTFIHENDNIKYPQKYEYVKILRGQLSTYEQIIFFLNSISQLGRIWELEKKSNPSKSPKPKNQLITAYNLIKNLPNQELIDGIPIALFYPLVSFEVSSTENVKNFRKALKKNY